MMRNSEFILAIICVLLLQGIVFSQAPDTLWTKNYGFSGNDEAWQLKNTPDGGYIIVGSSANNDDIYLLKTDENGDTLWTSLLGFSSNDIGRSVDLTDDGGYIITGYAAGFIVLMKADSLGNHIWHHYLGSGWGRAVRVTENGDYVVAGFTPGDSGSEDIFIARTDIDGDTIWTRTYGDTALQVPWDIQETNDGGFIIAGWTEPPGGTSDIYVLRIDANGDSVWSRTYGDAYNDEIRSVVVKDNGEFVLAGKIFNSGTGMDIAIINIDANGDTIWTRIFPDSGTEIANSIVTASDGNYVVTGMKYDSNYMFSSLVLKIATNGDLLWSRHIIDSVRNLYCRSIVQADDGGYVAAGYHQEPNIANQVFLCKLAPDLVGIRDEVTVLPENITLHQNYPNPFNANTRISFDLNEPGNAVISIYDLLGRRIAVLADGHFNAGVHNVTFNASDLSSGVYFYNLKAGDVSETKSMILLK